MNGHRPTRRVWEVDIVRLRCPLRIVATLWQFSRKREVFWQEFEMGRKEFSCNDVGLFRTKLLRIAKMFE